MKVKEIKALTRDNKPSGYSITVEEQNGKSGLITQQNVATYGGKIELIKVGDDVPVVFEEVAKKVGGGFWTSATFPDWKVAGTGGGFSGKGGGNYSKSGDDAQSKMVNNSLQMAVAVFQTLYVGTPTGSAVPSVEELFTKYIDLSAAKYKSIKE
jgi:hypothetical protein